MQFTLLIRQVSRAKKVIGLNRGEYRRSLGKKMGADEVYDKLPAKYLNQMDIVLEMSGNPDAIKLAFEAVRIAGTIIIFGIPKKEVPVDFGKYFINKELTVKSVFGRRIWDTWEEVSELLRNGKVDLSKMITHRFPLKDFEKALSSYLDAVRIKPNGPYTPHAYLGMGVLYASREDLKTAVKYIVEENNYYTQHEACKSV